MLFVSPVEPHKLDIDIGDAVKENTVKLVKCKASSANPHSSVDMRFFIGGIEQIYTKHEEIPKPGSDNGTEKTFVYPLTTDRGQNGKMAKCRLQWNGIYTEMEAEARLIIRCEYIKV